MITPTNKTDKHTLALADVLLDGDRVRVYYNLHKACWSIKHVKSGLVIGHADTLAIKNPKFIVSRAGKCRVRRTGKKNVHAYIEGKLTGFFDYVNTWRDEHDANHSIEKDIDSYPVLESIWYNPYMVSQFKASHKGSSWDAKDIDFEKVIFTRKRKVYAY